VFFYPIKLLFSGFLQFKGNFEGAQNNSEYRDWLNELMRGHVIGHQIDIESWTYGDPCMFSFLLMDHFLYQFSALRKKFKKIYRLEV